jgi:general secretion pathway protein D
MNAASTTPAKLSLNNMKIPIARGVVVSGVFALAGVSASAQQAPPPAPPAAQTQPAQPEPAATVPGGLNLNNASLLEVINLLAQDLHINYILDPGVKGGSVTINTYGAVRDVDLRPLLETILRMNGLAMVQVGNIYRIVPIGNVARQPVSPISETDASKLPDDERLVLNMIFLRYVTSAEMSKILQPFLGDGAQLTNYDAANLLIILDNSRNMRRTLELIAMFDSDTFAGQRVRAFDIKNGRPSDISKELDQIFQAYSLSDKSAAVRFLAIDRINSIIAVAPNPGTFTKVEDWLRKLDIAAKVTHGSVDNYVYKLKYAQAANIGPIIMQLYGCSMTGMGGYGGAVPGGSNYPASGFPGTAFGGGGGAYPGGGGMGGSPFGGGASPYGSSPYGSTPYGASPYGASPYGATGFGGGVQCGNFGSPYGNQAGLAPTAPTLPVTGGIPSGTAPNSSPQSAAGQTGTYLTATAQTGYSGPRIIPNPFDNTLLVQGTPDQWEQIRGLLEKLDIPPRQVLIDAKIYEVDLTGDFSAGVESYLQKRGAASQTGGGFQLTGSSNAAGAAGLLLSAGTLVGQSRQLLALLQATESTTKAKVLSAPSVIATDSIPASITVGDSVPTLSSQAVNPGITSNGSSLFTNTISNTSTGIGLNILARVNPSGVVTMVINQDVTAPTPTTTSNIDSPSFSQRNVSTQVTVEDGDTVAIGGIIEEATTETSSGIPYLHRIPYLGVLFGAKTSTKTRTELIIFLTPRVIYDTTQMTDATQELKDKVKDLRKMIKE